MSAKCNLEWGRFQLSEYVLQYNTMQCNAMQCNAMQCKCYCHLPIGAFKRQWKKKTIYNDRIKDLETTKNCL